MYVFGASMRHPLVFVSDELCMLLQFSSKADNSNNQMTVRPSEQCDIAIQIRAYFTTQVVVSVVLQQSG